MSKYKVPEQAQNLYGEYLRGVSMRGEHLSDASLYGVDPTDADLQGMSMRGEHLSDASLYGVDPSDADLRGAIDDAVESHKK